MISCQFLNLVLHLGSKKAFNQQIAEGSWYRPW